MDLKRRVCQNKLNDMFYFPLQTLSGTKKRLGCNSSIVYSALKGAKGITISQLGHSKDGAIWRQDTGHWRQVSGDTEEH